MKLVWEDSEVEAKVQYVEKAMREVGIDIVISEENKLCIVVGDSIYTVRDTNVNLNGFRLPRQYSSERIFKQEQGNGRHMVSYGDRPEDKAYREGVE